MPRPSSGAISFSGAPLLNQIAFCNPPPPSPVYRVTDGSSLPGGTKLSYQPSEIAICPVIFLPSRPPRGPFYFLACQKGYGPYTSRISQAY